MRTSDFEISPPSVFNFVEQRRFLQQFGHNLQQHYPLEPLPDRFRAMINRLDQVMQEAA